MQKKKHLLEFLSSTKQVSAYGGEPNFLYAALDATAYAVFFEESRMKCAGATKLPRKSGAKPPLDCFPIVG
jgi:hypothetical protein